MNQNITPPSSDQKQNTTMAAVAYILFFIPLLTGDAKKDEFVKYHVKQGLVLFILCIAINIIDMIIPIYFLFFLTYILSLGTLVLLVIGIKNALSGKKEPLPLVGQFSELFKF